MAVYTNVDISYLVGDIEVACNAKSASFNAEFATIDTTALCTTGYTSVVAGLGQASFDATLMADYADLGLDATLWPLLGVAAIPQSLSIGSAAGSVTYFMRGMNTSFTPIEGNVGELAMAQISGKSSTGKLVRGVRMFAPSTSVTATANGTGYQLGALSASQSLFAALHVLSRTGTLSMTLKIQSDDNSGFTTPTDRITSFTAATGRTYQWGSVAGAVTDDYWRAVLTCTGTGTMTVGISAGIAAT